MTKCSFNKIIYKLIKFNQQLQNKTILKHINNNTKFLFLDIFF